MTAKLPPLVGRGERSGGPRVPHRLVPPQSTAFFARPSLFGHPLLNVRRRMVKRTGRTISLRRVAGSTQGLIALGIAVTSQPAIKHHASATAGVAEQLHPMRASAGSHVIDAQPACPTTTGAYVPVVIEHFAFNGSIPSTHHRVGSALPVIPSSIRRASSAIAALRLRRFPVSRSRAVRASASVSRSCGVIVTDVRLALMHYMLVW